MSVGIDATTTCRHRRSLRLRNYDYAQPGTYYITMCTRDRLCLFGEIVDGLMCLNVLGHIVQACWNEVPGHYVGVAMDACVVMPNHVHGIVVLRDVGAGLKPAPTGPRRRGLPEIVRAFKTFSAQRINAIRGTPGIPVWQRNYFERVIRHDREWNAIRQYIDDNPKRWTEDAENPSAHDQAYNRRPTPSSAPSRR